LVHDHLLLSNDVALITRRAGVLYRLLEQAEDDGTSCAYQD
jgi:hypothetical protein